MQRTRDARSTGASLPATRQVVAGPAESPSPQEEQTLPGLDTSQWPSLRSRAERVYCLTLLYHPDLGRVGHCALVPSDPGAVVPLSRLEPIFAPPGGGEGVLLQDAGLSRKPHLLSWGEGDALTISPAVPGALAVNGEPLAAPVRFSPDAVRAGLLLDLSRRILLLVHPTSGAERAPRHGLVGEGDALEELRKAISRVADLQVSVLIRGETGAGKERVAQAIHGASPRATGPFVAINVATLSPSTAASELFGHERGSFTGATQRQLGFFERAHGGTLFLDEVGELSPEVQAMLLRALETGTILPLGGREPRAVEVRVLAATDADLEDAMAKGRFRAPLLHRLQGYTISVPPLRRSPEDIPRLLLHFLREELAAVGELSRLSPPRDGAQSWFPRSLMSRLVQYDWPGNVRQLRNVVRQIVISSRGSAVVIVDDVLLRTLAQGGAPAPPDGAGASGNAEPGSARGGVDTGERRGPEREIDEEALIEALRASGWAVGRAAAALGVSRTNLYRLIERSTRVRKAVDVPVEELRRCHEACGGDLDAMSARLEVSKRGLKLRLRDLGLT
jgi:two-component system, NtrC family, nitrogen regulation response regulator GlnG